ncbi:MAG: hypothetical protein C0467_05890 [Planctomycetaceae bacterium]|nr:hypothetical protein [Planctomycetaceae bacterium]
MMQTVNSTDSVNMNSSHQKEVLDYAKSLPPRFKAARAVEEMEAEVATRTVKEWEQAHPELGAVADLGWPEAVADVRVVLRAAALGMLMDDTDYAETRSAITVRRALDFLDVPAGAVNDLFNVLANTARETLPPAAADLLYPYLSCLAASARPTVV